MSGSISFAWLLRIGILGALVLVYLFLPGEARATSDPNAVLNQRILEFCADNSAKFADAIADA